MLAYAYEDRTTEGERNAESAWTLCKLSGTLSSLEVPPTLCTCLLLPSV
jgi:protein SHQ1